MRAINLASTRCYVSLCVYGVQIAYCLFSPRLGPGQAALAGRHTGWLTPQAGLTLASTVGVDFVYTCVAI